MGVCRSRFHDWFGVVLVLLASSSLPNAVKAEGPPASGETAVDDAAAREHFLRARAAYESADYETALAHFREAYRLSHRAKLHYNIGISAARLGKSEEALEAFEAYLELTDRPAREDEVRARVATLRALVEANEIKVSDALAASATEPEERSSSTGIPHSAIIGGSILGAVGVAGISAMAVGVSQSGKCLETDAAGTCITQRTASPWTAVYGAVGIAALAGSATWFAISSRRAKKERRTAWRLSPTGVTVSGSF